MKPIRVLHMIGSLNLGGSQALIMNIYRNIDRTQIQFDFIIDHPSMNYYQDEIERLGGRVYSFPTFTGRNVRNVRNEWDKFFKEHVEYSIIHFHVRSYISLLIPIAKRYGLITISHSHSISNGLGLKSKIKNLLQIPIRYQADYLFACSKEAGEWLFGKAAIKKGNFHIIKNAIDGKKFKFDTRIRTTTRKKLDISNDCLVLGNVGRITEAKNQEFLIDILHNLISKSENIKLIVVGDGENKSKLKQKIDYLSLNNHCLLVGSNEFAETYLNAMDFFIFPSFWEGLGMAAIEAQANGLFCFISNTVPKEVDIKADLVSFLPLEEGAEFWANKIINSKIVPRSDKTNYLKKSEYLIDDTVAFFETFYKEIS
uniref:Glycosyltransferase family 1 n=3 Tax=Streptococcus parauberis TaxID=1348 RepID=A0A0S3TG28_9STRE|nr:glycosyltransferase family 1 [Streptococcus parauberis]BAU04038.1 glycosyltransferase family 1 [Streptococcus parauberis]BAU04075.1 glycosyltransferase family 1 [Streptococcus parauberis]